MSNYIEREKRRASKRKRMSRRQVLVFLPVVLAIGFSYSFARSAFDRWAKRPLEIKSAGILWGEAANGLRGGIECVGPETPEAGWRRPTFKFHMRNEGDAAIVLAGIHGRWHSKVIEPQDNGQVRVFYGGRLSGTGPIRERWLDALAPGEETVAGEPFAFDL